MQKDKDTIMMIVLLGDVFLCGVVGAIVGAVGYTYHIPEIAKFTAMLIFLVVLFVPQLIYLHLKNK